MTQLKELFHHRAKFVLLILIIFATCLVVMALGQNRIPKDAKDIVTTYWDMASKGEYDECMKLLYFKPQNENLKEATRENYTTNPVLSYSIKKYRRINDSLYEISVALTTKRNPEKQIIINYVAYIDGAWKYITNSREVPNDIYHFANSDEELIFF